MPLKKTIEQRVTLKDIAAATGFSTMTVSSALRNQPKVRPETRKKILKAAEKLNYRPDPEVSKLMTHLRQPTSHAFSHTLAFINSWPDPHETKHGYIGELFRGARQKAADNGFEVDSFWLGEAGMNPHRLSDILHNRNIRGILLPPWSPSSQAPDFKWEHFCGVTATLSVHEPRLHRVLPHLFHNAVLGMQALIDLGYKRIAYVDTEDSRERSEGMFRGAYYYMLSIHRPEAIPLCFTSCPKRQEALINWFQQHRPDAILSPLFEPCQTLQQYGVHFPEDCGYIVLDALQSAPATAVDQRPYQLGAAAVDTLTAQIFRNERGIPKYPKSILLEGALRPGNTTRKQH